MYLYIAAWIAWFFFSLVRQGAHRHMAEYQRRTGNRPQISLFGLFVEVYVLLGFPILIIIGAIEFIKAFINLFN